MKCQTQMGGRLYRELSGNVEISRDPDSTFKRDGVLDRRGERAFDQLYDAQVLPCR